MNQAAALEELFGGLPQSPASWTDDRTSRGKPRRRTGPALNRCWAATWGLLVGRRRPVILTVRERPVDPATSPARALAAAVRQQLVRPGSISPQRQLELILADRVGDDSDIHDDSDDVDGATAGRCRPGWTPFLVRADTSPYRPLNDGPWLAAFAGSRKSTG